MGFSFNGFRDATSSLCRSRNFGSSIAEAMGLLFMLNDYECILMENASVADEDIITEECKSFARHFLNMLPLYTFDPRVIASIPLRTGASTSHEESTKWGLERELMPLFNKALEEFEQTWKMAWASKDGDDFQSDNVLTIWPKIKRENKQNIQSPRDVGEMIKQGILKQNSPMIEGDPDVYGVGFVRIKLSGKWMSQQILNMLKYGIETWAPRQTRVFKSTILNSPSWDYTNLMPIDLLRRQLLLMARIHMLEYVNCPAKTSSGNGMPTPMDFGPYFVTLEKDGRMHICDKGEGTATLVSGKMRGTRAHLMEGGVSLGYPLEDLAAIWRGLVEEQADSIECVTPSQQQEYIEKCFNAAKHAGWTTDSSFSPLSYVGFRTCTTSLKGLIYFLRDDFLLVEAVEAAGVLGYSCEAVLNCALTYTFLKYHRLADCKFNYKEMLDTKGDTFVYLLTTLAQVRKITYSSFEDIDDLKKVSELWRKKDKSIWSEGVERELGLHLLMFTELINASYISFLPHLICGKFICRYLYDLCGKFSRFHEARLSSRFRAKGKTILLLCEATAIVMEKGFHLLGITQNPSLKVLTAVVALNSSSPEQFYMNPSTIKNVDIRTRIEIFTASAHITRDLDFKCGKLFGFIQLEDHYGLQPDRWDPVGNFGPGSISVFDHDTRNCLEIANSGQLEMGDSIYGNSVPISKSMKLGMFLYATTKDYGDFFKVCCVSQPLDFSFLFEGSKSSICQFLSAEGDDGHLLMYYILMKEAVLAKIKVKLRGCGKKVGGTIVAYYGTLDCKEDLAKHFYKALLVTSFSPEAAFVDGDVNLKRRTLAVPEDGSLIIEANLRDLDSQEDILNGKCVFKSSDGGSVRDKIRDSASTLEVEVEITWSLD